MTKLSVGERVKYPGDFNDLGTVVEERSVGRSVGTRTVLVVEWDTGDTDEVNEDGTSTTFVVNDSTCAPMPWAERAHGPRRQR